MKKFIILDKSFVRSCGAVQFRDLEKQYTFLLTDEFIYETFKDSSKIRADTFNKFTDQNSYEIVPSIQQLMEYEAFNKKPTKPSLQMSHKDRSLHNFFKDPNKELSVEQINALETKKNHYNEFFGQFTDLILKPKYENAKKKNESNLLIRDEDLKNYINILINNGNIDLHSEIIPNLDESWVIFRFFQILNYYKYDLINKHQVYTHIEESPNTQKNILHDLIDFLYIVQGLLEGGLATSEKKIKEIWFKYAVPGSTLIFMENTNIEITTK